MKMSILFLFQWLCISSCVANTVPILLMQLNHNGTDVRKHDVQNLLFMTLTDLEGDKKGTKDFWLLAELLSLLRRAEAQIDYTNCDENGPVWKPLRYPSTRRVTPLCNAHSPVCPTCPQLDNVTECELFRDSCKERRVRLDEYLTYCDKKYGKWRTMFVPSDFNRCRCCDECIFYREMDQSCVQDELHFEIPEIMPVSSIDFRAGCNPYLGHPDQELKALTCDKVLRRCVPLSLFTLSPTPEDTGRRCLPSGNSTVSSPVADLSECPSRCGNFACPKGLTAQCNCPRGAFTPERNMCNCCGRCSRYKQLNEVCALFKKTEDVNGTLETEVEEELIEPGCDDGLVCRFGTCQDIHALEPKLASIRRSSLDVPYEPCKKDLREFKRKYGVDGHLHYDAPQCTPLWLYAPVQCRRFVCNCALEDGTMIGGTKTPRVEVSNMNCDCAREKCRSGRADLKCDGYGNYKEASFLPYRGEALEAQWGIPRVVKKSYNLEKNDLWDVS